MSQILFIIFIEFLLNNCDNFSEIPFIHVVVAIPLALILGKIFFPEWIFTEVLGIVFIASVGIFIGRHLVNDCKMLIGKKLVIAK